MIPYIDTTVDLQDRRWYVNDRVAHTIPGVRTDAGKIAELFTATPGGLGRVRCIVQFDDGGRCPIYFSELVLLRRRLEDEIPCAALEGQ